MQHFPTAQRKRVGRAVFVELRRDKLHQLDYFRLTEEKEWAT